MGISLLRPWGEGIHFSYDVCWEINAKESVIICWLMGLNYHPVSTKMKTWSHEQIHFFTWSWLEWALWIHITLVQHSCSNNYFWGCLDFTLSFHFLDTPLIWHTLCSAFPFLLINNAQNFPEKHKGGLVSSWERCINSSKVNRQGSLAESDTFY